MTEKRQYALKFTTPYGSTIQNITENVGHVLVWQTALAATESKAVTIVWRNVDEWTEDTIATPADPK